MGELFKEDKKMSFETKIVTTNGSELRVEFGYLPSKVEILNMTTLNKFTYDDSLPVGTALLTVGSTGVLTKVTSTAPYSVGNGVNDGLSSGLNIPTDVTQNVNNNSGEELLISAYRGKK